MEPDREVYTKQDTNISNMTDGTYYAADEDDESDSDFSDMDFDDPKPKKTPSIPKNKPVEQKTPKIPDNKQAERESGLAREPFVQPRDPSPVLQKINTKDQVSDQNQQYIDMVNQAKQEKKEKEDAVLMEKKKVSEENWKLANEKFRREKIKNSMPEEPSEEVPDIFSCTFRLPCGKRIYRRFKKSEKVQILQDYINIQENIGFEEDDDRSKFSLLYGYPRKAIDGFEQTIKERFNDKTQECRRSPQIV